MNKSVLVCFQSFTVKNCLQLFVDLLCCSTFKIFVLMDTVQCAILFYELLCNITVCHGIKMKKMEKSTFSPDCKQKKPRYFVQCLPS